MNGKKHAVGKKTVNKDNKYSIRPQFLFMPCVTNNAPAECLCSQSIVIL